MGVIRVASSTSRRGFLRIAVVAGAAPAALAIAAQPADAAAGETVLAGVVERSGTGRLSLRTANGPVTVTAAAGTRMYSGIDGQVTDAAAFLVGDRVGVVGTAGADGVAASRIGSIYAPLTAEVKQVGADGLVDVETSRKVRADRGTLPFGALAGRTAEVLRPGTTITGMAWTHPASHQTYLLTT
jgi:hypothetical protein